MAKQTKRKVKKNVVKGIAHVRATFNNTHVTITTISGDTISWGTAGAMGFKGTRKSTPFAAQRAADRAAQAAQRHGLKEVEVRVKGAGSGREMPQRSAPNGVGSQGCPPVRGGARTRSGVKRGYMLSLSFSSIEEK